MLSKCRRFNWNYKVIVRPKNFRSPASSFYRMKYFTSKFNSLSLHQSQFRTFWFAHKTHNLSLESVEKLRIFQLNYEKDPTNPKSAWRYFKELNRVGMHQTVVRLYNNYDYEETDRKLMLEYEYAVDHIDQIRGMVMAAQMYPQGEDQSPHQSLPKYMFKKSVQLMWRCAGLFVFVFIVTMIVKNINSRSLLDMYNFEIK